MKNIMLVLACIVWLTGCGKSSQRESTQEVKERVTVVKVASVERRFFESQVRVQGTLETKYYANVSSRMDGTLEQIPVDEGDRVTAGKTMLFVTDKVNRERIVENAMQTLAIQHQNLKVAEANIEKVKVEKKKAELDKNRYVRLHASGNATANEVELYTTKYDQAVASLKFSEATLGAVAEQVKYSEIALEMARKDLSDCTVLAPISGVVSKRLKEPGEQGSKGGVVLRIDDLNTLEAVVYIPGIYYAQVTVGKTQLRVSVDGKVIGEFPVSFKSPTIDPKLRTFEVKAILQNPMNLTSGAMADIVLVLERHEALAVPTHAIVTRANGTMVYLAEDNRAVPCLVQCGLENNGWMEVADAMTEKFPAHISKTGNQVVVEGQFLLSDNDKINIQ